MLQMFRDLKPLQLGKIEEIRLKWATYFFKS